MTTTLMESLNQELHPALSPHEASVESDRCYFCYDAPCITACPTGIDVPLFIRQIKADNPKGAGKTIFNENILGGMCARVCPTETLCEQACVRNTQEDKPVRIGELQRFATDSVMATGSQPYERAPCTGSTVAVIGAGPAGLACAHRLALYGHDVVIYEAAPKPGGLNEYGIAAYKTPNNFAQQEVDYVLSIGGISIEYDCVLGSTVNLDQLSDQHDAVFIGVGLGGTNALDIEGSVADGVMNAVEFIAKLRQTSNPSTLNVGRSVVVIGGGMTAVDAAVQSKILGSDDVTLVYRRSQSAMNASEFEQQLAQTHGVQLMPNWQPSNLVVENGKVRGVEFERTATIDGSLSGTGEKKLVPCDQVLLAIGQSFNLADAIGDLKLEKGRLQVNQNGQTSNAKIWAGGDCVVGGEDLTVSAVQAGKVSAESIHKSLGT